MFRKILLSFILIAVVLIPSGCFMGKHDDLLEVIKQRDKMIVGTSFDSKPFCFRDDDGQIKGVEVELAREIAKKILGSKDKVEFKNINAQERMSAVASGDVDMVISTMTITPQRKKLVSFSRPYFIAGQALCVKKDGKIETLEDLMNKRIIVILGTTGEKNIRKFAPNALIQGYPTNMEALSEFKEGLGDAITTDDALLQGFVAENEDYTLLSDRLTKEPYGVAFKRSWQTNALRRNVDNIVEEMCSDGTLDAIKNKWMAN